MTSMIRALRLSAFLVVSCVLACAPVALAQEKASKPKSSKPATTISAPVNLNTATSAQLEALPGVGAATAKLIVEHRQKNGGFKKIEELMNIKGIGEKSFLKLKPLVTVSPEKTDKPTTTS